MVKTTTKSTGKTSSKNDASNNRKNILAFYEKYLMTVAEASCYFHIGDKKMYELVREYEVAKWLIRNGSRLMVKRDLFARWLDQQAEILSLN